LNENSSSIISGDDYDREDLNDGDNCGNDYSEPVSDKVKIIGNQEKGLTIQIAKDGPNVIKNEESGSISGSSRRNKRKDSKP
jgi:hypothetical protein